ncbi:MAG: hypothetical protein QY326_00190 [Bdellovibrionota bacterium]|nr:MAG: hypothetical protein QY326_00190 [Bdellovibrionota bacterium]
MQLASLPCALALQWGLLLALYLCAPLAFVRAEYALTTLWRIPFHPKMLGQATMNGLAVPARIQSIYLTAIAAIGLTALLLWVSRLLLSRWPTLRAEFRSANLLGVCGLASIVFSLSLNTDNTLAIILCAAELLLLGSGILRCVLLPGKSLPGTILYQSATLIGLAIFFLLRALLWPVEQPPSLPTLIAVLIACWLLGLSLATLASAKGLLGPLLAKMVPLAVLPFAVPVAIEGTLALRHLWAVEMAPGELFLILSAALVCYALARRPRRCAPSVAVRRFACWFVGGLAAVAMFPHVTTPSTELFENGNSYLPIQQLLEFGRLPIVDVICAHVFSDFLAALLSETLTGFTPADIIGSTIAHAAIIALAFGAVITRKVAGSLAVAVFITIMGGYAGLIVPPYFAPALCVLFPLYWALQRFSVRNIVLLAISLGLLLLWRIDLGFSAVLASASVLLVSYLKRKPFVTFDPSILKSLAILGLIGGGALLALAGVSAIRTLRDSLLYFDSTQSYGYAYLARDAAHHLVGLYYVLLPVLLLAAIALIGWHEHQTFRQRSWKPRWSTAALLFLGLFTFFNLQRGLVRHSLFEGSEYALISFGYLFFILLPYWRGLPLSRITRHSSCILLCWLLPVLIKFPDAPSERSPWKTLYAVLQKPLLEDPTRKLVAATNQVDAFVDDNLGALRRMTRALVKPDQTFIDFTNRPMLYYHFNRTLAGQYAQSPAMLHSESTQLRYLERLQDFDIPVALIRSWPGLFNGALDGIYDGFRHFRVAEYLYRNYRPYAIVDGTAVWMRADLAAQDRSPRDKKPVFSLGASDDDTAAPIVLGSGSIGMPPYTLPKDRSLRVLFTFSAPPPAPLVMQFSLQTSGAPKKVEVPIVTDPMSRRGDAILSAGRFPKRIMGATLSTPQPLQLESLEISDYSLVPDERTGAFFSQTLGYIPLLWGAEDHTDYTPLWEHDLRSTDFSQLQSRGISMQSAAEPGFVTFWIESSCETPQPLELQTGVKSAPPHASFRFTVPANTERRRYRIRTSSHYSWFSKPPNWLWLKIDPRAHHCLSIPKVEVEVDNSHPILTPAGFRSAP